MKKLIPIIALAALSGGCAIHQTVKPVTSAALATKGTRQVCVIDNPSVRAGFVDQLKTSLSGKGYTPRMLPASTSLQECPITITYTASWKWDLALYMAYAEIKVFEDGRPAGEAIYSSRNGSANLGKFIDAETKIRELVHQLFPGGAGA